MKKTDTLHKETEDVKTVNDVLIQSAEKSFAVERNMNKVIDVRKFVVSY